MAYKVPVVWSERDGSDEIADYWHLYVKCAKKFEGVKGAELDDLVQEAAIAGWKALQEGYQPNPLIINRALMRYCRSLNVGGWRLVSESFR